MRILAFDIGGTFTKYALMNEACETLRSGMLPTPTEGREELIYALACVYGI